MQSEILFSREGSVAERIHHLIEAATVSIDAALYRFNLPRLARALLDAAERGVRIRLAVDRNKFAESKTSREILSSAPFAIHLLSGRAPAGSKMHHKFVILDGRTVLTGSYNWTLESEEQNYENLVILRDPAGLERYASEFEKLWAEAEEVEKSGEGQIK